MITALLLASVYGGRPIIPLKQVAADYFGCDEKTLLRKVSAGEVKLPITLMDPSSQKAPRGVHIEHLAAYIELRKTAAERIQRSHP